MVTRTQERVGASIYGGAVGLTAGLALASTAGRGAGGVVIGGLMGMGAGAAIGLGMGSLTTGHDPNKEYRNVRGSFVQTGAEVTFGATLLGGAGAAYFLLGEHPSARSVALAGAAVAGAAMVSSMLAGLITTVPEDPPPAPKPTGPLPTHTPQPLPGS